MDPSIDRPDLDERPVAAGPYRLLGEPEHQVAPDETLLTGYYRATFEREGDEQVERYLTDAGRAAVLRRQGEDDPSLTAEEFEDWTVEPDLTTLLARVHAEAGQGG